MRKINIPVEQINSLLPQTQCEECGYPGCKPYADAIVNNNAELDLCKPGGTATLKALGELLDEPVTYAIAKVQARTEKKKLAVIDESLCIGCVKCIKACPVDAIVGAKKLMHTVIETECTGCQLCIDPCPMDCIDLIDAPDQNYYPVLYRKRYENRQQRLQQTDFKQQQTVQTIKQNNKSDYAKNAKKDYIKAALARVRQRKNNNE
jgi:electron transport complex protein RnfB